MVQFLQTVRCFLFARRYDLWGKFVVNVGLLHVIGGSISNENFLNQIIHMTTNR